MDIEISPGAALERSGAPPRDKLGLMPGELVKHVGAMTGKRVCSGRHSAPLRRERRFIDERNGILWRHSSVNLVGPRHVAPPAA